MVRAVTGSFLGLLVGVMLGARHALEPDHLAAVSVLAADAPGARRGALLGAVWGIGHGSRCSPWRSSSRRWPPRCRRRSPALFELAVAVMLIGLGARAIVRAVREGRAGLTALHAHGEDAHRHAGPAAHVHVAQRALALRPLVVGVVHGLAGSGALTALVLARLPSTSLRIAYIALFGIGSIVGMSALSGLVGWPLARLARRPSAARLLFGTVGAATAVMGLAWGWPAIDRLF